MVLEAADRAHVSPWSVQEKMQIIEFIKETRKEIEKQKV